MPINIQKIAVKGLGPLEEFTGNLGNINLIYGRNEQGKTYLVEFLIKSLFKNITPFHVRDINPSGKVTVAGLEPGICQFSPSSKKKLEHFWEENNQGMPINIAQLLVVKGADLDFIDNAEAGISKKTIKSFLSSEEILDKVQGRIQATVREAEIHHGQILGANRGELKNRESLFAQLKQVEGLIDDVNQNYSGGRLTFLLSKQKNLSRKLDDQENAKRYFAYDLAKSIQKNEDENKVMEERGLTKLVTDYDDLLQASDDLHEISKKQELEEKESEHFEWLDAALIQYENFLNKAGQPPNRRYPYIAAASFMLVMGLALIGFILSQSTLDQYGPFIYCGIGFLTVLGTVFGYLFYQQHQRSVEVIAHRMELNRIERTYKEKFFEPLSDLAQLKNHHKTLQVAYLRSKTLAENIEDLASKIDSLRDNILRGLEKLRTPEPEESMWQDKIDELENTYNNRKERIQKYHIELANLDVAPDQYLETDPGIEFNKGTLNRLNKELEEIQQQIREEGSKLDLMKARIRTAISDQNTAEWEELLDKLNKKKIELSNEYKRVTSNILAGILVSQVLREVRKEEDEKLKASLQTPTVERPLFDITKRYKEITLEGANLFVSDGYEEFNVANLSTAAREQVLLALRLGIAEKIMGEETAFLVLDDAFQHSDWLRRAYLMDTIASLTSKGWQIIYFTMDDHIRDLFNDMGRKKFISQYHYFEL